jgi:hypothetical protein
VVVRLLESRFRLAWVVEGAASMHRIGRSFVSDVGTGRPCFMLKLRLGVGCVVKCMSIVVVVDASVVMPS